ncbi:MAG: ATP-binding protein [Candidatus Eisenbacteria bacterium]
MTSTDEMSRMKSRLEQREQLGVVLEGLLESLADGVVALDFRGEVTHVSDALLEPSLTIGAEVTLPQEILARLRAESERVGTIPRRFEIVWHREETGTRIYQVVAAAARIGEIAPELPANGTFTGPVLTLFAFHDTTSIHELRRELDRTRDLAALGRMAATVAHELRNPLGVIQGFATLHQRDLTAEGRDTKSIDRILQGVEGANRIVEDLLEYSRPVAPKDESISVEALLAESTATLEVSPRFRRGISVDVEVDPRLPAIRGDRRLLLQALANLYHNAVDAIDGDGSLSVRARATGGFGGRERLRVVVRDSGCGLSAEEVQRIFEPFYTTKPGGTGLGMAIVRRTIEAHGGEIHVVSARGRGTSVVLDLPAGVWDEPVAKDFATVPEKERTPMREGRRGEREALLAEPEREAA